MAHICFFRLGATPLFVPDSTQTFGGAEVRALTFARGLARAAHHQVSFAVSRSAGLAAIQDGIRVVGMPPRQRGVARLYGSIRRRLSDDPVPYSGLWRIAADVVACFGVHDPTAGVIAAARHSGVKSVLFLTSSEDVDAVRLTMLDSKERRRQKARDYALRNADEVVVQTEFQQRALFERIGRTATLIRNPAETFVTPEQLSRPRRHVLWVGRADCDSKRADICFSLARRCKRIPFCVVLNDSDSPLGKKLLADCPPNLQVVRHMSLSAIEDLYSQATVLINTSVSEGFPNAFLQAARFATPVIALNVDPDGMLSARGCGEMAVSETRMIELIRTYHRGGPEIERIGATARQYVVDFHDVDDRVAELSDLVDRLMHRKLAA